MDEPDRDETETLDPKDADEATPEDHRGSAPPSGGGDPEPTPGEDAGPMGNPASDEEALRHHQEDATQEGSG